MSRPPFERNAPYAPTPDNRPRALRASPLPLTTDADTQMSFGERAAVEGVLAEVRPRLAIEIGTAEGGTLRRIAARSAEVHSIDVSHDALAGAPPNVTLHTGASHAVLPPLLDSLAAAGRTVDFVLVDGDHSFEGVAADLNVLLESAATARTVILVHDSLNAEVRAGVESVGLEGHDKVVYCELDFVAGYVYREGVAAGSAWGGLALVLTGSRRSPGYEDSPRQRLYHEPFEALQRLRAERP
jgi:methyltransferase family protein